MGIVSDRLRWRVWLLPFIRWGAPALALLFVALWAVSDGR